MTDLREAKRYFYGWWMFWRAVWMMRFRDRNEKPSLLLCLRMGSAYRFIVDGQFRRRA